ncbi:MAG: hypothetical protein Q8P24_07360 [Desulfobacterales bacterium]|nr:hypothetical protein [Desulfobacterales bacterium]
MLDVAVSYNRYKFIGHEFLTWLWFVMENQPEALARADNELLSLEVGSRMVLENNRSGKVERITIKADQADLEEAVLSLRKGSVVSELKLIYKSGSHEWRFSLKGESFNVSGLKTPPTGAIEIREDVEGAVLEKIFLYEKVFTLLDRLYREFIRLRLSGGWEKETVPAIRKWLAS